MNKLFQWIKRISIVFFALIILPFVGCDYGWNWKGPYHHAAIIECAQKTLAVGGETYSIIADDNVWEYCLYKHKVNGQLERVLIPEGAGFGEGFLIDDIASYNGKLYFNESGRIFCLGEESKELVLDLDRQYVASLLIQGGKIYYTALSTPINVYPRYCFLCSYDIDSGENTELFSWEENGESVILTVFGRKLFVDEKLHLAWCDSFGEGNRIVCSWANGDSYREYSFVLNDEIAYLKTLNDRISFSVAGEQYEYFFETAGKFRLYPYVKVIDNKVYFAINDDAEPSDCEHEKCICRYRSSAVMVFDLESKQFSKQTSVGEREVILDLSKDYCMYYSQGNIYKKEEKIAFVGEIGPCLPLYRRVEGWVSPAYCLNLAYDGENLYSVLQDQRQWMKDEY